MSFIVGLRCVGCGAEFSHKELRYHCDRCGGVLDPIIDYAALAKRISPEGIRRRPPIIWRKWREFLPMEDESLMESVSLEEYETPLLKSTKLAEVIGIKELFLKNDTYFPTCSLKDRSMPMVVEKALEFRAKTVCITSSGNAAASLAAYAARAGLECVLFVEKRKDVPSRAQLAQMLVHGARVILLEKLSEDVFFELRDRHGWYDCDGQINPFRLEGKKTYAHAIWEQMGGRLPDRIVLPIGVGNGVVATWKGLQELKRVGFADRLPTLAGAQPEASAPIVEAFLAGKETVEPVTQGQTICAISPGDPGVAGQRTLDVLREGNGQAAVVSDEGLLGAVRLLASEGIFTEPAGALALAGLVRLREQGLVSDDEVVVVTVTGHGLKHPETLLEYYHEPPVLSGSSETEIERALGY
jgi:threonine synthase